MKNFYAKPNEKTKASKLLMEINETIGKLEAIKQSPVLAEHIETSIDWLSQEEQDKVVNGAITTIENMSFYFRFEEGEGVVEVPRQFKKILDNQMKHIKNVDLKIIDRVIDRRNKCISYLRDNLVDHNMKGKRPTTEYVDKLTGFMTKKGKFKWADAKIDELFASLMK